MGHPLAELSLDGSLSFDDTDFAARDFGGVYHSRPLAVVRPASAKDIAAVVRCAAHLSPSLTVAARGNGHSTYGQALADAAGVVLDMPSLRGIHVSVGASPQDLSYVDASGGELWIDVLRACLREGLAPRTWPDYLYLSVGGTIQCAGVGGQTFRFGPVISNVLQLDVITGRGDLLTCSPAVNSDLFFAVLGGLGQFGIVSKARILISEAPCKVRWMRALYADFRQFTRDQERLISMPPGETFDYLEGFVVCNSDDPVNGWGQVPLDPVAQPRVDLSNHIPASAGPVLYCLEVAKHFYRDQDDASVEQEVAGILRPLGFVRELYFERDVGYEEFLNRVHTHEVALREAGTWEAPHPWLCLLVAGSCMERLDAALFKQKLTRGVGGPMLIYPMLRRRWDQHTSVVIPDEDIFYLISLLRSNPAPPHGPSLESLLAENDEIVELLLGLGVSFTIYMPQITSPQACQLHFGSRWQRFVSLKQTFDPLAILSPGQRIFPRVFATLPSTINSSTSITPSPHATTFAHPSLRMDHDYFCNISSST